MKADDIADQPGDTGTTKTNQDRRRLLNMAGAGGAALGSLHTPTTAGPFNPEEFEKLVPRDKKLSPQWVQSLFDKGEAQVYRGIDLKYIGMPVGGVCTGQLYLGGDGRLWHWDIFNRQIRTYDGHYASPVAASHDAAQGFAVSMVRDGRQVVRHLDQTDCPDVTFRGEYPIGVIDYGTLPGLPLAVRMEAFSPFVPLDVDDSSLPATLFSITVSNRSEETVEATVFGWLENLVCGHSCTLAGQRVNRRVNEPGLTFIECLAVPTAESLTELRPDICFEDWDKETYEGWTVEGEAFGSGPILKSAIVATHGDVGGDTARVVNSNATAPGVTRGQRDQATGRMISRKFTIERNFLNVWIGGGNYNGETCINVVVDGQIVRTATGYGENRMRHHSMRLKELIGREACIELLDTAVEGWGHIGIGRITFSDHPVSNAKFEQLDDFGTMGLALLGDPADFATAADAQHGPGTAATADVASQDLSGHLVGGLGRMLQLAPGASQLVEFAVCWHFPNLHTPGIGRHYATRFDSARAVALHVARHGDRLRRETRLWRDTWYNSTLPWWLLDRTFANASILASSTCHRFANGAFWGWEGVGCCEGTCTHVWLYEQAMGRIFPQLDINLREQTDFNTATAFHADGSIGFRGGDAYAVDGQAGIILRCLRDHQVSPDNAFLTRNWANIKKALQWLIDQDGTGDGILKKSQHNTLDAEWYGEVAWLSGLYLAALRAGEEMALESGDAAFAATCRKIVEAGRVNLVDRLFNGEYFIHVGDPAHPNTVGSYDGCEIDQVLGQSWAYQVGLGEVLPRTETLRALDSLWRYNFTPDVGNFRKAFTEGRWYAMAGEAGTLMCSWPRGDSKRVTTGYDYYFNECMNGFEYQLASHMVWEKRMLEGLAIIRAVHDRYHASRRNPWNEIECGDHYARSMASYGVFTAACGFEYHGPRGHIGFAPRLTPENFMAAFTAAEGWGTFEQQTDPTSQRAAITVKYGKLRLRTVALELPEDFTPGTAATTVNGRDIDCALAINGRRAVITLGHETSLDTGDSLAVVLR